LDNVRPAHRRHLRRIEALKLERSLRYRCLEVSSMADEPDIHTMRYLRHLDAMLDLVLAAQKTTNRRLSLLETRVTGVEASIVHVQERLDGLQAQLDNATKRLDRIERRLDLTSTPAAG
jgi:hypothetical protein